MTTIVKLLAPFLPFLAEEMYQNLVCSVKPNAPKSVHHNDWPLAGMSLVDEKLMVDMDLAVKICGLGRSARNKAGIKLRQPLKEVKVVAEETMLERLKGFTDLVKDELNVKEVVLATQERELVNYEILLLPHLLGKKYGKLFPKLCATVANMDADALLQTLKKDQSFKVEVEGDIITLLPEEVEVRSQPKEGYTVEKEQSIIVGVYTIVTEELKEEGLAREIVRRIQSQRKDAGFDIADQIEVYYEAGPRLTEVFNTHGGYIASETLSGSMHMSQPPAKSYTANYKIDGESLKIGLIRKSHT